MPFVSVTSDILDSYSGLLFREEKEKGKKDSVPYKKMDDFVRQLPEFNPG